MNPRSIATQGLGRSTRLVAVQGLWPDDEAEADDEDQSAFGVHRPRAWRPAPITVAAPPKRPRRRRREEILFLGA